MPAVAGSESTKELFLLISGQIDARSLVPFDYRRVHASVIGRSERGGEQQRRPDSDVWYRPRATRYPAPIERETNKKEPAP